MINLFPILDQFIYAVIGIVIFGGIFEDNANTGLNDSIAGEMGRLVWGCFYQLSQK
jgi:hypothetical protein